MEIKLLTEETISRISAGEVIERPLNVVKELVENAIDAGSTAITVEIRDGGISMVRVTDNGCGIERDQIARAFVRHATSKITDADDLSRLSSLGFRGEALASIASVSQVEMITKVREAVSGTRAVNDHLAAYSPDQPVRIDLEEIGAPDGTTVIVRNLFGSIPVRRKFLRQPQTEAGYITDLMEKQALSHPLVSFHYRVNGQDKLHTTGNGSLKELIYRIYGRETAGAVIPVHAEDPDSGMVLDGFLGKPEVSRSSRSFETFFINGRMLRSKELSAGLEAGYRTDLMQHRFPFAVLHLTMPPEDVDVNVHPSKMEVRFSDRRAVYRFLDESVHSALHAVELIPKASLNTAKEEREQSRKEARLKAEQLRNSPRYEAFESARTPRRPLPPASSKGPASPDDPAGIMTGSRTQDPAGITGETRLQDPTGITRETRLQDPAGITGETRTQDPAPDTSAPSLPPADPTVPPGRSAAPDPSAGLYTEISALHTSGVAHSATGSGDGFVFEDRRPGPGVHEAVREAGDPSRPVHAAVGENEDLSRPVHAAVGENEDPSRPVHAAVGENEKSDAQSSPEPLSGSSPTSSRRTDQADRREPVSLASAGEEQGQLSLDLETETETGSRDFPAGSADSNRLLTREKAQKYRYIGQIFGTYWIIEYEKKLLIIDQHAAHEKVNYERMMRRIAREHPDLGQESAPVEAAPEDYLALDRLAGLPASSDKSDPAGLAGHRKDPDHTDRSGPGKAEAAGGQGDPVYVASQQILPPIVLRLSGREESAYQQFRNVFAAMGYEIEEFGAGSYAIRAVPTELFGQSADSLLREILEEIMNERISGTPQAVISKVASMSCKAAVKGNTRLSETEARALIDELLTLDNPYHCPHGRPTMIVMDQHEMDRKFKRIL